ncbi:MAG: TadE/TadG family type IV pilus assembly protein [Terracidiphilus sp.]
MKSRFLTRRGRFSLNSGSGQALVELAMILAFGSILLLLSLGVVEFGKLVYWSIEVSNAAKAGAQYGALNTGTANDSTGIQNAAAAAAPDLTSLTATPTASCVCSTTGAVLATCTSACVGDVKSEVTVNTSVTVTPPYKLKLFPTSFTLTGSATQECAQ